MTTANSSNFWSWKARRPGLSWHTVLKKRENYRAAFDRFDPEKVARYSAAKIARLLGNAGIIRNRLKIHAAVQNAKAFLKVQEEFGSFDAYIWRFVDGQPNVNHWQDDEGGSGADAGFRCVKQGFEAARVQICRLDDLLRTHAGDRHGQRSSDDLFPAPTTFLK